LLKRAYWYRLATILYMALIFRSSSGPIGIETVEDMPDHLLHAAAYAVLYLLIFLSLHEGLQLTAGRGGRWLPFALTVLYGVIDEVHQYFVPGRHATAQDVAADAAGALLALLAIAYRSRPGGDRRDRAIAGCSPGDLGR
ncbi:MAG: hypothetical protein FJW35_17575, partial [Acidobacteria bacterium]|nr:hypothetical protein [Acidobacteriota bacterium]